MKTQPSSSNIIINMLTESCQKIGLPIDDLLRQLPSQSQLRANEKVRMPIEVVSTVWQWFTEHGQDENIGLKLGKHTPLTSQTLLTYMVMSCKTLDEVLDVVVKFQWFICEGDIAKVKKIGDECHVEFQFTNCSDRVFRHQSEYAFLLLHYWLRDLLGDVWQLNKIQFIHPKPKCIDEHIALFGCDFEFSSPSNALIFDKRLLNTPIRYANEQLNSILQEQAKSLELYIEQSKVVVMVTKEIQQRLSHGHILLEEVAQQCQLSDRQLKSILEQQGTNFTEIIEQEKKSLAKNLLEESQLTVAEVSDKCGFAEPSTFNRAFKRWFACTPSQFRRSVKVT